MFLRFGQTDIMIILVYVDDILITGNSQDQVDFLITRLHSTFALRDLGQLSYFLGVEVTYDDTSLHLCQTKYIADLLERNDMMDCKPVKTPGTIGKNLSKYDGEMFEDETKYRNADYASTPDDRKSSSGYCIFFGDNLVSWSATKQKVVSPIAAAEIIWTLSLLQELCIPQYQVPLLWFDNISSSYMTANPVFHSRSKHIEIDIHFVRDQVLKKKL
ncbi:hypothetical protein UlMin_037910 [Ulmus minor]